MQEPHGHVELLELHKLRIICGFHSRTTFFLGDSLGIYLVDSCLLRWTGAFPNPLRPVVDELFRLVTKISSARKRFVRVYVFLFSGCGSAAERSSFLMPLYPSKNSSNSLSDMIARQEYSIMPCLAKKP